MLNMLYCENCKEKTRTHCDQMHGEGLVCMCIECGFVRDVETENYKSFTKARINKKPKGWGVFV